MTRLKLLALALVLACGAFASAQDAAAPSADKEPSIVIFWSDGIGQSNISAYKG